MRLLPAAARINQGNIFLDGKDLLALPEFAMRDIRGRRIAMIFTIKKNITLIDTCRSSR